MASPTMLFVNGQKPTKSSDIQNYCPKGRVGSTPTLASDK